MLAVVQSVCHGGAAPFEMLDIFFAPIVSSIEDSLPSICHAAKI